MTSSDLLDTALGLRLKRSGTLVIRGLDRLLAALRARAVAERDTLMIGRTHGVHAEPTTFGLKTLVWYEEVKRNRARLEHAFEEVAVGKLSGAVGTFAHLDPAIETAVMQRLGLEADPISTQIVQRDRHAALMTMVAVAGATLEKIATEIRNLQRTDILELEEPFGAGQQGSSAMPHKRNPIRCERVTGLARLLRGNALVALENVALWHERDITHSSAERVILPDSLILLDTMLDLLAGVIEGLVVHRDRMLANIGRSGGLIFSQRLLLALIDAGLRRDEAYLIVQRHAMAAWEDGSEFRELVAADPEVAGRLAAADLDELFDPSYFVRRTDAIFERVLGKESTASVPAR